MYVACGVLPLARPITLNGGYEMPGWSDINGLGAEFPEDSEVSFDPPPGLRSPSYYRLVDNVF